MYLLAPGSEHPTSLSMSFFVRPAPTTLAQSYSTQQTYRPMHPFPAAHVPTRPDLDIPFKPWTTILGNESCVEKMCRKTPGLPVENRPSFATLDTSTGTDHAVNQRKCVLKKQKCLKTPGLPLENRPAFPTLDGYTPGPTKRCNKQKLVMIMPGLPMENRPLCPPQQVTMIHRGVAADAPEAASRASPPVAPDIAAESETQERIGRFNERSSGRQRTLWQTMRDSPLLLRRLWSDIRRGDTRVVGEMIGRGVQLHVVIVALYIVCPVSYCIFAFSSSVFLGMYTYVLGSFFLFLTFLASAVVDHAVLSHCLTATIYSRGHKTQASLN